MRVLVEFDRCEANGLCADAAPEVFRLDADDRMRLLTDRPAPDQQDAAELAARACPKLAITLRDED